MYRAAGIVLGNFLKERYTETDVTVLLPPEGRIHAVDTAVLQTLREHAPKSFGFQMIHLPERQDDATAPFYIPVQKTFDEILRKIAPDRPVVSLVGLPEEVEDMTFWKRSPKADLILINTSALRLKRLIQRGDITALLVRRPEIVGLDLPPDNLENWLLITPESLQSVTASYPGLFAP